jgi:hypothetical protein
MWLYPALLQIKKSAVFQKGIAGGSSLFLQHIQRSLTLFQFTVTAFAPINKLFFQITMGKTPFFYR